MRRTRPAPESSRTAISRLLLKNISPYSDPQVKGSWELPVDLSKVEAILFGDVVITLEQPKK